MSLSTDAPSQPVLEIFPYVVQVVWGGAGKEYQLVQVSIHRIGIRRVQGKQAVHEPLVARLSTRHTSHFTTFFYLHHSK